MRFTPAEHGKKEAHSPAGTAQSARGRMQECVHPMPVRCSSLKAAVNGIRFRRLLQSLRPLLAKMPPTSTTSTSPHGSSPAWTFFVCCVNCIDCGRVGQHPDVGADPCVTLVSCTGHAGFRAGPGGHSRAPRPATREHSSIHRRRAPGRRPHPVALPRLCRAQGDFQHFPDPKPVESLPRLAAGSPAAVSSVIVTRVSSSPRAPDPV